MTQSPLLILLGAGLAFGLFHLVRRASHIRAARRAAYFSRIAPSFDSVETRVEPSGFPRMTLRQGRLAFDLQAIPDSLTFRKLPALWVMLTLPTPMPTGATIDIMARPSGNEPFSNFNRLPQSLPCPDGLPEGTVIRTDDATAVPPRHLIEPWFRLFADPKVKELVLSPKGLRLVILAEEAERGKYLIFRDAEVGKTPLQPERILPLAEALLALHETLTTEAAA